jgi:hypothetical protein
MSENEISKSDTEKPQTKAELQAALKRIQQKLQSTDNQRFGGAPERMPRARMLDARSIEEKDPAHHYRYVNTDDPGKVQTRMDEGYQSVPEDEARTAGVRRDVGEGRLMKIPRAQYEERIERQKKLAKDRLEAHKADVRQAVEGVAKELRDRYGIKVDIGRLLVDE